MKVKMSEFSIIQIIINIRFDWVITINVVVHLNIKNIRGGRPAIFINKIVSIRSKFLNVVW